MSCLSLFSSRKEHSVRALHAVHPVPPPKPTPKPPKPIPTRQPVYGDFIRTFTFSSGLPSLPIVLPNGSIPFPIATVPPVNCRYVESEEQTGLLVPKGVYRVKWLLSPSEGASVTLLVNGEVPTPVNNAYPYTQQIVDSKTPLGGQYYIQAIEKMNLLSLVNTGPELLTLGNVPNTRVGDTAIITHVQVEKL